VTHHSPAVVPARTGAITQPDQELVMNDRMPDELELVIGVDTHKHTHTPAVVDSTTGAQLAVIEIAAEVAGYEQLLAQVPDRPRVWAIEGAGSYGAGLARWLVERDETVLEVERPRRPARHHGAKTGSQRGGLRQARRRGSPSCLLGQDDPSPALQVR
jgi:transposase